MVFRFPNRSAQSYAEQLGAGNLSISHLHLYLLTLQSNEPH
jgi:hypothetical protein